MPDAHPVQSDRERDAGFRGGDYADAAWFFGLVFAVGLAIVAAVLFTRRRRSGRGPS